MEIVGIKIVIGLNLKLSKFLTDIVEYISLLYQKAKLDGPRNTFKHGLLSYFL